MATLTGVLAANVEDWLSGKNGVQANLAASLSPVPYIANTRFVDTQDIVPATSNTYVHPAMVNYTFSSIQVYSPYDDIYNRFYVIPKQISFGAITGDTSQRVLIWNAHIVPEQVDTFSQSGYTEGDNVTNNFVEIAFPLNFFGLEVKRFEVAVGFAGNPEFSIEYVFGTSTNEVVVDVTGFRSVLFSLSPNRVFTHGYKFESRITESFNTEQRAKLGSKMFETFSYKARASEFLRTYYRQLMNAGTLIRFSVPVWEDWVPVYSVLSGMKHIDVNLSHNIENLSFYVGQSVVMWSDAEDYEQAKIIDIDYSINRIFVENEIKANRSDFFLMPLRAAINDDAIELEYRGVNSHHFDCNFKLLDQTDVLDIDGGLEFLNGKPFLLEPNYQGSGKEEFGYERDEFKGVGSDITSRLNRGFSQETKTYVWQCGSREELLKLKQFIFTIRGKWKSFWLPRFGREFKLYQDINVNDSLFNLDIRGINYNISDMVGLALFIQSGNADKYYGKINAVTNDGGVLAVSCDKAITFTASHDSVIHLCLADLVRSTTDEFEIEFEDINDISCKISARKVKE